MHLGRKVAAIGIAAALVTGAGAVAVAPAQAAPAKAKVSGKTLISFKKQYAGLIKLIAPIKPAQFYGSQLGFPVTGANGSVVTHSGGVTVGGIAATNPVLTVNVPAKTASITFTVNGSSVELFTAAHFKAKANGKKSTVWQGDLKLTSNQVVVDVLSNAIGTKLTPGVGLGQIRTTINNG